MMAFAAVGMTAMGMGAVSFAQTPPAPGTTPPPPPIPAATTSPLVSSSAVPTPLPSDQAPPTTPPTTPTPEPFASPSAAPSATPAGRGRHGGGRGGVTKPTPEPSPSDTPEPPQFSTLDGVWEVALQPLNGGRTIYSHLYVTQTGNTLSGVWRRTSKAALPFTGTFDGRLFKITVTAPDSKTLTLSGYEENYMDMVGLFTDADPKATGTPFTAGHRKSAKERERDEKLDPSTRPGTGVHTGAGMPPH
jgi:hypothetical protein